MRSARPRSAALTLVASAILAEASAHAQSARHVQLTPDASADRTPALCLRSRCYSWRTQGFTTAGLVGRILDFAGTRTGRIVAVTSVGVMYTDDRGVTWRRSPGIEGLAFAVAFDAGSDFGVLVGDSGKVWTTEDGGLTWRNRRDDTGVMLVRVGVIGRVVVMISQAGAVWLSTDGMLSVRVLIDAPATTIPDERALAVSRDVMWVQTDQGNWLRVGDDGSVTPTANRP